ncbi:hypothetical protein HYH03_010196 [Edaphochlamys debaryana]|uniref:Uncharacterized protein n=1 Tax=Edaphochlamys debaryana TaxID=47281 RepID=A0A835Y2J6_9CHLO|nr:hypothetical protein HYH03_010196 [Edaphochlamys debaryana]|eukprot:KAG2491405.1 hypothetical protein HYH03_010196 [Edaphochlamys debaryana]
MAKQAGKIVKDLAEEAGAKKVAEADILDRIEKMCDPDENDGDWLTHYDLVVEGDYLKMKDTGKMGKCKSECRTIARACEQIAEDLDLTDLSAMLYKGKKRAAISNWMCHESSDSCTVTTKHVHKDRVDEEHVPMDPDEISSVKMLRNMKAAGLSGSMYSRETMQEELAELAEEYEDDPNFAKLMKESGMDKHIPGKDSAPVEEPGAAEVEASGASAMDTAAAKAAEAATKLQEAAGKAAEAATEAAAKAADAVKEGAAKVVENAKGLFGKLFGKKEEKAKGGEL